MINPKSYEEYFGKMNKKFFLLALGGVFLFSLTFIMALTIDLNTPVNATTITEGEIVTFNCSVDAPLGLNYVELLANTDKETTLLPIKTFSKGSFEEAGQGNNFSANYLNEYQVDLNPTTIIKTNGDETCDGVNDACNLLNTSGGNAFGGYYNQNPAEGEGYIVTLNDTYLIHNFKYSMHSTYYSNHTSIEYSLDNSEWTLAFNDTSTATINYDFSTPIRVKYLRVIHNEFPDPTKKYIYAYYINISGQVLNTSTPFNLSLLYNYSNLAGGNYLWGCKAYTDAENLSSSNFTFTMNGTQINWVSPTPESGTETTFMEINTSITSDYDAYSVFNFDNSIVGWWTFDNALGRLNPVQTGFGNVLTLNAGTPIYPDSRFGQSFSSVAMSAGLYKEEALSGTSNEGFTLAWTWNVSNASFLMAGNYDIGSQSATNSGYKLRFTNLNGTHSYPQVLIYNGSQYMGGAVFSATPFPSEYLGQNRRWLITADMVNQEYAYYVDGVLMGTKTTSFTGNYFEGHKVIRMTAGQYHNFSVDDIIALNRSVTNNEAELLSQYSKINYFEMDYLSDTNVSVKPYGYDNQSVLTTIETRTFNFLQSPTITYMAIFNKDNQTIYGYCRAELNGDTFGLEHFIQYSNDNATWINLTETYERSNDTYAIIGDSMYNGATDVGGALGTNMGISTSEMNIYAVAGHTCTQVYQQLIDNVTNDTTNLIAGCGVNGGIPATNPEQWENIYNQAKAKNISNIYISTMPPWDTINTYDQATADDYCNRQKEQNEWLINFAANHSDLYVVDIWTDWHDTSGTNKTDCGWAVDSIYRNDVTHPNTAGYQYWADKHWNESFNRWVNNTWQTNLTLNQAGDYYFRCYTDGDRPSLVSAMGVTTVNDTIAPNITLVSPANASSTTSTSLTFEFNVSDTLSGLTSCSLFMGSTEYANTSAISETETNNISVSSIGVGSHTWYVYCNDTLGNEVNSSSWSFTITATTTEEETTSSGSGTPTYYPTESNLQEGYSKQLYNNWEIKFKSNNESHSLKLNSFNSTSKTANITISSEPQTKTLSVGEEWKVNLNNDSTYDLLVRLENVNLIRANLFMQEINESIFGESEEVQQEPQTQEPETTADNEDEEGINYGLYSAIIVVVIVIGFLIYFNIRKAKR